MVPLNNIVEMKQIIEKKQSGRAHKHQMMERDPCDETILTSVVLTGIHTYYTFNVKMN